MANRKSESSANSTNSPIAINRNNSAVFCIGVVFVSEFNCCASCSNLCWKSSDEEGKDDKDGRDDIDGVVSFDVVMSGCCCCLHNVDPPDTFVSPGMEDGPNKKAFVQSSVLAVSPGSGKKSRLPAPSLLSGFPDSDGSAPVIGLGGVVSVCTGFPGSGAGVCFCCVWSVWSVWTFGSDSNASVSSQNVLLIPN